MNYKANNSYQKRNNSHSNKYGFHSSILSYKLTQPKGSTTKGVRDISRFRSVAFLIAAVLRFGPFFLVDRSTPDPLSLLTEPKGSETFSVFVLSNFQPKGSETFPVLSSFPFPPHSERPKGSATFRFCPFFPVDRSTPDPLSLLMPLSIISPHPRLPSAELYFFQAQSPHPPPVLVGQKGQSELDFSIHSDPFG